MRSSILMLSVVALLAGFGLRMTGGATGVAVSDGEAVQLLGGVCQCFRTYDCSFDGCPAEVAAIPGGPCDLLGVLANPHPCGGVVFCTTVYDVIAWCAAR